MNQQTLWDDVYRSNSKFWRGNARIPIPLPYGDALDMGCGNGKTVSTLLDNGFSVTGVDFSSEAIRSCRELFKECAAFIESDVCSLPFEDCSFDYITAVHVLEHLDDRDMQRASTEILRVLRPEGYLFIRSFAPGDLRESKRTDGIRYIHRTPEQIASFFDGLDVVSSELVQDRTRFGAIRCRSECLFRKE